jgi:hypothetical protein
MITSTDRPPGIDGTQEFFRFEGDGQLYARGEVGGPRWTFYIAISKASEEATLGRCDDEPVALVPGWRNGF